MESVSLGSRSFLRNRVLVTVVFYGQQVVVFKCFDVYDFVRNFSPRSSCCPSPPRSFERSFLTLGAHPALGIQIGITGHLGDAAVS